jgi:hypothetical protein
MIKELTDDYSEVGILSTDFHRNIIYFFLRYFK